MPFDQPTKDKIGTALVNKIKNPCPSCGKSMRQFLQDVYMFASFIPLPPSPYVHHSRSMSMNPAWGSNTNVPPENPDVSAIPCIATICMNCGHTEFYNVHVLGLAEALNIPKAGVPIG